MNELEEVLVRASKQPAVRAEFYQKLLDSQIWLLSPQAEPGLATKTETPEAGAGVQLTTWKGKIGEYVPLFSSLEQLQTAISGNGQNYQSMALAGDDVFAMLAQKTFGAILNPGASCGKHFLPAEIHSLAEGNIPNAENPVMRKNTPWVLSRPADYPHSLVAALQEFFARFPAVEAAYLAQSQNPASEEEPHLLIGIKCGKDLPQIATGAITVAQGVTNRVVDFVQADGGNSAFSNYFQTRTAPFYRRTESKRK